MIALEIPLNSFRTQLALIEGGFVTRLESNHFVVAHLEADPALLTAEAAMSIDDPVVADVSLPAAGRRSIEVWAVPGDQRVFGDRESGQGSASPGTDRGLTGNAGRLGQTDQEAPTAGTDVLIATAAGNRVVEPHLRQHGFEVVDLHLRGVGVAAFDAQLLRTVVSLNFVEGDAQVGRPLKDVKQLPERDVEKTENHGQSMERIQKAVEASRHQPGRRSKHQARDRDGE